MPKSLKDLSPVDVLSESGYAKGKGVLTAVGRRSLSSAVLVAFLLFLDHGPGSGGSLPRTLVQILFAGLVVVAVCVAWCVIACRMQGLPIRMLSVRPLSFGLRMENAENLRRRLFFATSALPVACLTLILISAGCALLFQSTQPGWLIRELYLTAGLSAALLVSLAVRRPGSGKTGLWSRLRVLRQAGQDADRLAAQTMLSQAALAGIRPRSQNVTLIEMAAGREDGSVEHLAGRAIRYAWLIDQERIDEAEDELVWLLSHPSSERFRRYLCVQASFFSAYFRDDAVTARKWFAAAGGTVVACDRYAEFMAEAALALIEGRPADVMIATQRALDACRGMHAGAAQLIREPMLALRLKAQKV